MSSKLRGLGWSSRSACIISTKLAGFGQGVARPFTIIASSLIALSLMLAASICSGRSEPCPEPPSKQLAWVSCDENFIVTRNRLRFSPNSTALTRSARATLDSVGALLERNPRILLVRIEGYGQRRPDPSAESNPARRREMLRSQRRADAVLRYLWRSTGVSAERMEAVGYGFRSFQSEERWPIRLRIVQRARR